MTSLISSKLNIKPNPTDDEEYLDCICDLMSHEVLWSMENFRQHAGTSCLDHSFNVSYMSYSICKRFNLDFSSAARGGLLHDLFLYDWHKVRSYGRHGFTHPRTALRNANKYFDLNKLEKEIIKKHMWPLTVVPSIHMEVFVVVFADKYCTFMEIFRFYKQRIVEYF